MPSVFCNHVNVLYYSKQQQKEKNKINDDGEGN